MAQLLRVKSQKFNPNDPCCWTYVYATIIDCGGMPATGSAADSGAANRAFWFHTGEGPDSQVVGFTIRNGYARGPKGADARTGFDTSIWRGIPYTGRETAPWQTFPSWQQAVANNPAIDPCTLPPAALDGNDATPGNGYGGAILCQGSSPTISYCVIENCTATGISAAAVRLASRASGFIIPGRTSTGKTVILIISYYLPPP